MSEEEDKKKEEDDHFYHRQLEVYHRQLEEQEAKTKKLNYEDHWDAFWNNDKSK